MTPSELAVNLHSTMDAKVWTDEYIKLQGGDWGLMMGWFSNAIMVGYDHAIRKSENRIEKLERVRMAAKDHMSNLQMDGKSKRRAELMAALDACEEKE